MSGDLPRHRDDPVHPDAEEHVGGAHGGGHGEEQHEGEPWLISYADLMTLLFGFFVIMYTFAAAKASTHRDNSVLIKRELARYFGGPYINPLEEIGKKISSEVQKDPQLVKDVQVISDTDGVNVIIRSQLLFKPGSAAINDRALPILEKLISSIKGVEGEFAIRVLGYTDDVPIHNSRFPSNWELSGARASSVIRLFESSGFDPDDLVATGFGSSHAAFPNLDAKGEPIFVNRAKNRRVEIQITAASDDKETLSAVARNAATPYVGEAKVDETEDVEPESVLGNDSEEAHAKAEAEANAKAEAKAKAEAEAEAQAESHAEDAEVMGPESPSKTDPDAAESEPEPEPEPGADAEEVPAHH